MARIIAEIEPEARALGFGLVRVRLFKGGEIGGLGEDDNDLTLQIMAERPETGQLIIADCAALSRRVSDRIDALEEQGVVLVEGAYRLEVSSPGIDRPLTRVGDYTRWAGHEAKVQLVTPVDGNRKNLHGDLAGMEGEAILFDDRKSGRVTFTFDDVQSARLVLTDRLIAATRPLDAGDADEILEDNHDDHLEEQED